MTLVATLACRLFEHHRNLNFATATDIDKTMQQNDFPFRLARVVQ